MIYCAAHHGFAAWIGLPRFSPRFAQNIEKKTMFLLSGSVELTGIKVAAPVRMRFFSPPMPFRGENLMSGKA